MAYEYNIVGEGPSVCLVEGKLAEAGARVFVLDAGGSDKNPLISMLAGFNKLLGVEKFMRFYQPTVRRRLGGRESAIPPGRVVGGGSSVNAMVYVAFVKNPMATSSNWFNPIGWRHLLESPRDRLCRRASLTHPTALRGYDWQGSG